MTIRQLEIRDRMTFIPVLAIKVSGEDGYLLRRAGFSRDYPLVIVVRLSDMKANYDPFRWMEKGRTMPIAHAWITEHFDTLADGDVVDVEFIQGETKAPKPSERDREL